MFKPQFEYFTIFVDFEEAVILRLFHHEYAFFEILLDHL